MISASIKACFLLVFFIAGADRMCCTSARRSRRWASTGTRCRPFPVADFTTWTLPSTRSPSSPCCTSTSNTATISSSNMSTASTRPTLPTLSSSRRSRTCQVGSSSFYIFQPCPTTFVHHLTWFCTVFCSRLSIHVINFLPWC